MDNKYTIVMCGDTLLHPSGVSLQAKYIVEHLIKTKNWKIIYLGTALKNPDHRPIKLNEFGEDFVLVPVDSYAPINVLREIIHIEKPAAIWFITDPRFFLHLFQNEAEIHQQAPLLWSTIWDNSDRETFPSFNKYFYQSCDFLGCINKSTHEMMSFYDDPSIAAKSEYIPHGVPKEDFKILDMPQKAYKIKHFGEAGKNTFFVFYNSRNALRKRTNNAVMAFKRFLDQNPTADAKMIMHASPFDPEGSNLLTLTEHLGIKEKVLFSTNKIDNATMCELYNVADCTIQLSSEEGFGLAILESLMCGTPVICSRTGGMQDQAIDPDTGQEFGFCIKPAARSLIGSQMTPWVWSDHVSIESATDAIQQIYDEFKKGTHKTKFAGEAARASMLRRFDLTKIQQRWEDVLIRTIEEFKAKQQNKEYRMVEIAA